MKIRQGFVSNSSSSSFVIGYYGDKTYTKDEVLLIMKKLIEVQQVINPNIKMKDVFTLEANHEDMCIGEKGKDIFEIRKEWESDDKETDFNKCKGKIIVHSVEDNSVPYWMKEFFENTLNAKYWHWG